MTQRKEDTIKPIEENIKVFLLTSIPSPIIGNVLSNENGIIQVQRPLVIIGIKETNIDFAPFPPIAQEETIFISSSHIIVMYTPKNIVRVAYEQVINKDTMNVQNPS